jgi:hypothetical protein
MMISPGGTGLSPDSPSIEIKTEDVAQRTVA